MSEKSFELLETKVIFFSKVIFLNEDIEVRCEYPTSEQTSHIRTVRLFNATKTQFCFFRIVPLRYLSTLIHMAHLTSLSPDL